MILLSHPTVNRTVCHTARALNRAGVLGEFWTYLGEHNRLVLRRVPPSSLDDPAGSAPANGELAAPSENGKGCRAVSPDASDPAVGSRDQIAESLDREMSARVETEDFRGVYAYEDGADATFRAAGRRGLLRIYDLPRGNWRDTHPILEDEAAREPEWAPTLRPAPAAPRALGRVQSELQQADLVFVESTFGLQTLECQADIPATIAVVPPGAPQLPAAPVQPNLSMTDRRQLRVLFAGNLGQRAGLSYLFKACRELGQSVALTVIGQRPANMCAALQRELDRVHWLPTSSADVIRREMGTHEVFLFPSVFDSGTDMLLEALAMGLPIIATPNSAAPDLIRDGVEGFVVPVRSTDAIVEKLDLLRRQPDLRLEMSIRARRRSTSQTWEKYERTVAASVAFAIGRR